MTKKKIGVFICFLASGSSMVLAGTCSLCREALATGGSRGLIRGYFWSIVLLVVVHLLILSVGVRYAWKRYNT